MESDQSISRVFSPTNPFANASVAQSSRVDALTNFELSSMDTPGPLDTFEHLDLNLDTKLPIHEYKEQIVAAIRQTHCVIISGATGCGKTTQIPKLIVEDAKNNCEDFNIIITQPRKIAAITNATRVADEIGCQLGTLVGYQVSLHQELDVGATKILYCTTGVLLNKLMRARSMKMYSHIILDEIHERDIEMDFLIIVIRRLLHRNTTTRIILMSATMNCEHFGSYFRTNRIIKMRTERKFTIERRFLDDLHRINMSEAIIKYDSPHITAEMMNLAADIIFRHVKSDHVPSILVFLPGLFEIENFEKTLLENFDVKEDFKIIVLHSALPPESQKRAFKRDGQPKIILSTNIAENSVTIPDISIVIDFCLTKYLVTSPKSNLASLKLDWTSTTSCEQRAGRTGRVCDGIVYHLVHREFFDRDMKMFTEPEMKRIPLEQTVLKTKLLTNEPPMQFLIEALDAPTKDAVVNSVLVLKQVGAMMRHDDEGEFRFDDGELTFFGRVMACLPCDIYIAKFILLGHLFSVLDEAIIIGAGLSINGSVFRFDYKKRLNTYCSKVKWSQGSGSDLHAIYNVYKCWQKRHKDGHFRTPGSEESWFREFNLDRKNMMEIRDLIKDLKFRLEEHRIKTFETFKAIVDENKKSFMLKICAAGAWLPFYYLQTPQSDTFAYQEIGNLDVHRTVYFKNADNKYCALYNDLLKKALVSRGICNSVDEIEKITFEESQPNKVFVTFKRHEVQSSSGHEVVQLSNSIVPQVYFGMKDKETASILKLEVMDKRRMREYASQVGFSESQKADLNASTAESFVNGIHEMQGFITHVENCGKFFFQPSGGEYDSEHKLLDLKMRMYLNGSETITSERQLTDGDNVLVRYGERIERAVVVKMGKSEKPKFHLIDRGLITDDIDLSDISRNNKKGFKNSMAAQCFDSPPKCFECTLTGVAPSGVNCPSGHWTAEANDYFCRLVEGSQVLIEIYSVVDDIVSVTVFVNSQPVNQKLVEAGFAMTVEEDLLSRSSHNDRRHSMNLSFNSIQTWERTHKDKDRSRKVSLIPPRGMLNQVIELPGPYSPLESSIYGITELQRLRIKLDSNSVNSIILNGDINSAHSRFYVAANVTENQNEGVTLREVVMMENIPGLAEILALVFCQAMKISCNADQTSYTTLLVGLGSDEGGAFFAPNDGFIPVTVQLTDDDFGKINDLRSAMSQLAFTPPHVDFPELTERQKYDLQSEIVKLIIDLLQKPRKISNPEGRPRISWDEGDNLDITSNIDPLGARALYAKHSYPKLSPISQRKIDEWKSNHKSLVQVANSGNKAFEEVTCKLCNSSFNNKKEILAHCQSLKHLALVKSNIGRT